MGNGVASLLSRAQAYAPQAGGYASPPQSLMPRQPTYAQFNPQGRYGLLAQNMAGTPPQIPQQPQGLLGGQINVQDILPYLTGRMF